MLRCIAHTVRPPSARSAACLYLNLDTIVVDFVQSRPLFVTCSPVLNKFSQPSHRAEDIAPLSYKTSSLHLAISLSIFHIFKVIVPYLLKVIARALYCKSSSFLAIFLSQLLPSSIPTVRISSYFQPLCISPELSFSVLPSWLVLLLRTFNSYNTLVVELPPVFLRRSNGLVVTVQPYVSPLLATIK